MYSRTHVIKELHIEAIWCAYSYYEVLHLEHTKQIVVMGKQIDSHQLGTYFKDHVESS